MLIHESLTIYRVQVLEYKSTQGYGYYTISLVLELSSQGTHRLLTYDGDYTE
jgi:hypothetical protein